MEFRLIQRLLLLLVILVGVGAVTAQDSNPPNIVLIFTDDQGYADVGVFGAGGFKTPNLDRLAKEGRQFKQFYVAQAVCSASRAALMTGCYPNRIGISGALGPNSMIGLNADEMTLAELVKQKDYATAIYGKWHLGDKPEFLPLQHGFDDYYGLPYSNDMWPHHPESKPGTWPDLPLYEKNEVINPAMQPKDQELLTRSYTQRAVKFIDTNAAAKQPFFLYLAHNMPHVPLYVSTRFRGKSQRGLYGDVMMEIDWSVGEVMAALERNRIADNTLVIFVSDNGPWLSYGDHAGSAFPLREGKGTSWEGGVRVPCIMRWPGRIAAGTVCNQAVMSIDLFPTIAALIGARLPDHPIDGRNVWPILSGEPFSPNPHPAYFFYYNQNDLEAVLSGDGRWKLVLPHRYRTLDGKPGGYGGKPSKYTSAETGHELYNLELDISERNNVATANPEIVMELLNLADVARNELGDNLSQMKGKSVREPGRVPAP